MKESIRNLTTLLTTSLIGGIAGAGGSWGLSEIMKSRAEVAFKIRPELANLNWGEAFYSNHLMDYTFMFNGDMATNVTMGLGAIIGAAVLGNIAYKHIYD